jgi:hypothetical protein
MTEELSYRSREFLDLYDPIQIGRYRVDIYSNSAQILASLGSYKKR